MTVRNDIAGLAALSICRKSLLLAMNDRKLLPESEIIAVLRDAAATHENAANLDSEPDIHGDVATLINRIIAGVNSARIR